VASFCSFILPASCSPRALRSECFPDGEALRVSGSHKKHHKRKCEERKFFHKLFIHRRRSRLCFDAETLRRRGNTKKKPLHALQVFSGVSASLRSKEPASTFSTPGYTGQWQRRKPPARPALAGHKSPPRRAFVDGILTLVLIAVAFMRQPREWLHH